MSLYSLTKDVTADENGVHRPERLTVRQVGIGGEERLVAVIEENDGAVTVKIAPGLRIETLPIGSLLAESDMSLRPRPGESPEDVIERVTRAAREKRENAEHE